MSFGTLLGLTHAAQLGFRGHLVCYCLFVMVLTYAIRRAPSEAGVRSALGACCVGSSRCWVCHQWLAAGTILCWFAQIWCSMCSADITTVYSCDCVCQIHKLYYATCCLVIPAMIVACSTLENSNFKFDWLAEMLSRVQRSLCSSIGQLGALCMLLVVTLYEYSIWRLCQLHYACNVRTYQTSFYEMSLSC